MRFNLLLFCTITMHLLAADAPPESQSVSQESEVRRGEPVVINYKDKQHGWRTATLIIQADQWAHDRVLKIHGDISFEGGPTRPIEKDKDSQEQPALPTPKVFYTVRSLNYNSESKDSGLPRCTEACSHTNWTDFWASYPLLWQLEQEVAVTLNEKGGIVLDTAAKGYPVSNAEDQLLVDLAQACLVRAAEFAFVNLDVAHCKEQSFSYQTLPSLPNKKCVIKITEASAISNTVAAEFSFEGPNLEIKGNALWDRRAGLACQIHEEISLKDYPWKEECNPWALPANCTIVLDISTSDPR